MNNTKFFLYHSLEKRNKWPGGRWPPSNHEAYTHTRKCVANKYASNWRTQDFAQRTQTERVEWDWPLFSFAVSHTAFIGSYLAMPCSSGTPRIFTGAMQGAQWQRHYKTEVAPGRMQFLFGAVQDICQVIGMLPMLFSVKVVLRKTRLRNTLPSRETHWSKVVYPQFLMLIQQQNIIEYFHFKNLHDEKFFWYQKEIADSTVQYFRDVVRLQALHAVSSKAQNPTQQKQVRLVQLNTE